MTSPQFNKSAGQLLRQAMTAHQEGRLDEAIAGYREVIKRDPNLVHAHNNLGMLLAERGQQTEAVALYRKALSIEPKLAEAHNNLGIVLREQGELANAIASFRKALEHKPDFVSAYSNLGMTFDQLGNLDDAIVCYRKAIEIKSDIAETHNNLGVAYKKQFRFTEAKHCYQRATDLKPDYALAYDNWAGVLKTEGRLNEAVTLFRKALECNPNQAASHSNLAFTLHYIPGIEPREIYLEHCRWGACHVPAFAAPPVHANAPDPGRRLRIGYISPDMRSHSVAFFLEPILAAHDRNAVETFAYADVKKPDDTTARMKALFTVWHSTIGLTDNQVVELIKKDQIDILVDLAGHTEGNRLRVLAQKPAPVQVTYIGYPNTTGLKAVDYRLTDRWADPVSENRINEEELVRLPHGFLCYKPSADAPQVMSLPAAAKGYVTFGSFNVLCKVNEEVVETWSQILNAAVPAHLFLKSHAFADKVAREHYLKLFSQHGVEKERLHFASSEPSRATHLGLYGEIDIALDTFPYNGTTTTCEALWMGVPIITLAGHSHVSRVGCSLLESVGLPEYIAKTRDEYITMAIALAGDLPKLAALRSRMRTLVSESRLCDAKRFTAILEITYRTLWRRWCARQKRCPDFGSIDDEVQKCMAEEMVGKTTVLQTADKMSAPPLISPYGLNKGVENDAPTHHSQEVGNVPTSNAGPDGWRAVGRVAELAILADALARLGQRSMAFQYAKTGLSHLKRGQHEGGFPQSLLNAWGAATPEGLFLRQCLSFSHFSTYFSRERSQEWLMGWAKLEPHNPEPFLRFGLLFALMAATSGKQVPEAALNALRYAQKIQHDERPALALKLLQDRPQELVLPYDGTSIHVYTSINNIITYALLERDDWYEDDLDLFRKLIKAGDNILDLGANLGVFALSAAQRVGAEGRVVAVEPVQSAFELLSKSAAKHKNMILRQAAVNDLLSIDGLADELGITKFDVIKMAVKSHEAATIRGATRTLSHGSPIVFCKIIDWQKDDRGIMLNFVKIFHELGYESFMYCAGQNTLVHLHEKIEIDSFFVHLIAMRPEHLRGLRGIVTESTTLGP